MEREEFKLIEKYLDGLLNEVEADEFARLMETDQEFKNESDKYQNTKKLLEIEEALRIENQVKKLYSKHQSKSNNSSITGKWWKIAAAVLLLALSIPAYLYFSGTASDQRITEDYFEPYPDRYTTMGSDVSNFMQALSSYNSESYALAIQGFNDIPEDSEYYASAQLYKAVSFIAIEQDQNATPILEQLKSENSGDPEVVNWYLALAYVNLNEMHKAVPLLEAIANNPNSNFKKSKAESLLKKIK